MTQIKHLAIIMDGNGRWAQSRGRPRFWGHIRGATILPAIVEEASRLDIDALTLFTFSTENWTRPRNEVAILFRLLHKFLLKERSRILEQGIRFRLIGVRDELPAKTKEIIYDLENRTQNASGMKLNFAFNYGGRQEILNSVNQWIARNPGKALEMNDLTGGCEIPECQDVDLLIRTGGDQRVSNFLLWQIAYADLVFVSKYWPDFEPQDLEDILCRSSGTIRRFGGLDGPKNFNQAVHLACARKVELHSQGLALK